MRTLTVPATLILAPLAFGCSTSAPADASVDALADARDAADDARDAADARDATDARDAQPPICEAARYADGGVYCREENVQGTGAFCIRYRCDADDGGATLNDCCRLIA